MKLTVAILLLLVAGCHSPKVKDIRMPERPEYGPMVIKQGNTTFIYRRNDYGNSWRH